MFENMNFCPAPYALENIYNASRHPSAIHAESGLRGYFQRYLLQKIISGFEIGKIPEDWEKDYFLYSIFVWGYAAIIRTTTFGVIPQWCTLAGRGVFWQPTDAIISNPLIENGYVEARIGEDCALIRLQPDYGGCWDIVTYYADLMAEAAMGAATNIINSKLAYVFLAKDKGAAETFKKLSDKIASGELVAAVGRNLFTEDGTPLWQTFNQNLQQTYIAGNILDDMAKLEAQFNTAVGIPNVNIAKASGVSDSEVHANDCDTFSRVSLWKETLERGFKQANEMFGLELTVKLRWEDQINAKGNTVDPGTV